MSAIKITNKKSIKQLEKSIVVIMQEWIEESDEVKVAIISALLAVGDAPATVQNCVFKGIE